MIVCFGTTPALSRTMRFAALEIDGVNRATETYEYAAGKATNTARAALTLGEPVFCIGPTGGATADRLRATIDAAAIPQEAIAVASASRLCVTVIDDARGTSTELVEASGPVTAAEGERLLAALAGRLSAAKVCVLSGSLAPGLGSDFYARAVRACRTAGVRCVLDASGDPLREAIGERPDFVKVNAGELASVLPIEGDDEAAVLAAADTLAKRTGGGVVVTRGRASTLAVHATQGRFAIDVPAVKVVSAIGSGDSFAGGFAVAMARGMTIEAALALATACASANAMTAHAAHFDVSVVEQLRQSITVRRI